MSTHNAEKRNYSKSFCVSLSVSGIETTDGCAEGTLNAAQEQTLFLAIKKTKSLAD